MKRIFDLILSAALLLVLAPFLLVLAMLVRILIGSPILFRQRRPGLNGQPFEILKFRTMTNTYDRDGRLLPDNDRMTRFGTFMRSSSLDELPELINILRGEMSFVGPRPLLMDYLPLYSTAQARRHEVRPGITGWAQVNGRNAIDWERKFVLDLEYVDHRTLWFDMKILALTAVKVAKREGISADGEATMPRFMGNGDHKA